MRLFLVSSVAVFVSGCLSERAQQSRVEFDLAGAFELGLDKEDLTTDELALGAEAQEVVLVGPTPDTNGVVWYHLDGFVTATTQSNYVLLHAAHEAEYTQIYGVFCHEVEPLPNYEWAGLFLTEAQYRSEENPYDCE